MRSPALRLTCFIGVLLANAPAQAQPARELVLHKWSGTLNVPDPVAVAVDPQGRVYVAATTRRKQADLDIREHTMWIPGDVAIASVADKRALLHRELAPGKLRGQRGMLKDHNGDGSVDWKDLTVHTERIYQMRDTDADGTADKMTVFAEGFNTDVTGIAAGVMYHDGWVYLTCAPDVWRLKDTDDDGVADVRELVATGIGHHIAYAGHDMHGLIVGPDGRIYWSMGDKGVNVTSKEGRHFFYPNEGTVMRADPDGSNFEVYARGGRNVQEPAFNDFGDLIGVDNDADQPTERERFVYIAEASDSGWRNNYQYMATRSPWMREGLWKPPFAGQAAYHLPPIASYSDGPAGFRHEPGTALGDAQRGLFLLNEFPSGRMRAFRAEQDGATFKMADARVINDGVMGIGMSWHPDGSLFIADWIGGYPLDGLGAIWRVDSKEPVNSLRAETRQLLMAGFNSADVAKLAGLLGHRDQRVRQGAQLELARRDRQDVLLATATRVINPASPGAEAETDDMRLARLARIHGLWGYGQLLRRNAADAAVLLPLLRDADPEIRAQTAKVLGDAASTAAKAHGATLIPLLADAAPRTRLQAAIALAKFREPRAVDALFTLAAQEGELPVMRHAAVTGLAGCATPAQLAAKKTDASLSVRLAAVVALRRLASPLVAEFLGDSESRVVEEVARAIHDDLSIVPALPALAAALEKSPASEVIARRAINANLRVGQPTAAARLLTYALNEASPRAMREEALISLRVWKEPPPLDRVDGWARTIATTGITEVLSAKLDQLLALGDTDLKTIAVEIMIAHGLKAAPAQIAAIVGDAKAPGGLRGEALRLLEAHRGHPAFLTALDGALARTAPTPLHRVALEMLLPGDVPRLVLESTAVLAERTVPEKQHVIGLLAKAAQAPADAVLAGLADDLVAGRSSPELNLDIVEALRARRAANPALATKLQAYLSSQPGTAQAELLAGGDPVLGRTIVTGHLNANCMACHALDNSGGSEVGPNLRSIGAQRDPAYLLESLLQPSAQIATGYGIVNVTLKDRTEVTGTLARETPDSVTVRQFDGSHRTLPRQEITAQSPPVSIMPPMTGILQPREVRDTIAFLSSLRARPNPPPAPRPPANR